MVVREEEGGPVEEQVLVYILDWMDLHERKEDQRLSCGEFRAL